MVSNGKGIIILTYILSSLLSMALEKWLLQTHLFSLLLIFFSPTECYFTLYSH